MELPCFACGKRISKRCSITMESHRLGGLRIVILNRITRPPNSSILSKVPNETDFQKTLSTNDFYFGGDDWPYPMGHISFVG